MTKAIALSDGQAAELTDYNTPNGLIRRALDDIPQARLSRSRIHRVPVDFPTIQSAVDAANEDDVIELLPGEYQENVVINIGLIIRPSAGLVRLRTQDENMPLLLVELDSGRLLVEGVTLEGKIGIFWSPQIAVQIWRGEVSLKCCQIRGWQTASDLVDFNGDLLQENRYWSLWQPSPCITVTGDSSTVDVRNCQFRDSDMGAHITDAANAFFCGCSFDSLEYSIIVEKGIRATICGCSFDNVGLVMDVSEGTIISKGNTIMNGREVIRVGKNAVMESQYDSWIDGGCLLGVGEDSSGSVVTFNHATIRCGILVQLMLSKSQACAIDDTWNWRAPQVIIEDSIVYQKSAEHISVYLSGWSLWQGPQLDVWTCIEIKGQNIIWASPTFVDLDPMFDDVENGQLRLKPESPAIGAGSDGTNLGAWQGIVQ